MVGSRICDDRRDVEQDRFVSKTWQIRRGHTADEPLRAVNKLMGDPRNVAHAKKVSQEKHHKASSAQKQRAQNVQTEKKAAPGAEGTAPKADAGKPAQPAEPTQLEKSLVVLSKLKELEFHSRANIEKLAELSLTIEDELKQKPFVEGIGDVYAAQNAFQSKILELIGAYETECTRLSGSA